MKILTIFLGVYSLFIFGFVIYVFIQPLLVSNKMGYVSPLGTIKAVIGDKTAIIASPTSQATSSAIAPPKRNKYTIAIIGDSMVDTMGETLEYLDKDLKVKYPKTTFKLYNYGIGGQNVAQGLARFDSPFSYQTRSYPPISLLHPDILIVGSFAYNPFSPYDRNKHWLTLAGLIDKAKANCKHVYLFAEIAPLENGFGKGPHGVNWPTATSNLQAFHITQLLDNAVSLATNKKIALIDAYEQSEKNGKFGNPLFVNKDDGIHPSVEGHQFVAKLIGDTIQLNF